MRTADDRRGPLARVWLDVADFASVTISAAALWGRGPGRCLTLAMIPALRATSSHSESMVESKRLAAYLLDERTQVMDSAERTTDRRAGNQSFGRGGSVGVGGRTS